MSSSLRARVRRGWQKVKPNNKAEVQKTYRCKISLTKPCDMSWCHLYLLVFHIGLSSADYQQPGKASCVSVNWTLGDAQLEVVNTATGRRRDSGTPSRLCKHALFTRWNRLYRKVREPVANVKWLRPYDTNSQQPSPRGPSYSRVTAVQNTIYY